MTPAALTTAAALAVPVLICVSVAGVVARGVVEACPVRPALHLKPRVPAERPVPVRDSTVPIQVGGQR